MKVTPLRFGILAAGLLSGPAAWAQEADVPAEPGTAGSPAAEPAPAAAPPPAPAPVHRETASPVGPVARRVAALEARLAQAEDKAATLEANVSSLKKLKFSGYVQGRYEWHQDAVDGWENWKNQNRFSVRHGYLGARYEGTYGEFFLQIDANTGEGVALKDAEASLVDPWTPFHFKLTVGQFKLPFGYEITQSDADRELPERAAAITGIFPGDRDRGVRLQAKFEVLRLSAALVNGALSGTKDPTDKAGFVQNGYAPNGYKTVVGRLGVDLGSVVGGLSGMWGRTLDTGKNPGEGAYDYRTYKYYEQLRLGADLQVYLELPMGGLALKGEVVWARKENRDYNGITANPCLDSRSFGWIATLVQNFGEHAGLAVRVDEYDPLLSGYVSATCYEPAMKASKEVSARDTDKAYRLGVAGLLYASANTKITLSYEHPWEQPGAKKKNDIVTAQLQARF